MRRTGWRRVFRCFGVALSLGLCGTADAESVVFARHLALSPDGKTLAFAWAGDIWSMPTTGGAARRLTVHPGDDDYPVWSRDGRRIAFASDRYGADNVFVMSADGDEPTRLTFSDRPEVPTDWSPDGEFVYFQSRKTGEVSGEPRFYRVPVRGGQSWRVMDCFATGGRVGPDGRRIAFTRGYSPWWRRGYRGSGSHRLWVREPAADGAPSFRQLTAFPGMSREPAWDATGAGLYFLSDRFDAAGSGPSDAPAVSKTSGEISTARPPATVNVWYQALAGGEPRRVTSLAGDDVRDLAVSADGKTAAFTHWDRVYVMTPPDGAPRAIEIDAGGDQPRNPITLERLTRGASDADVSPDGKELALVVRGDAFVIKADPDRPTRRVTQGPPREQGVAWSPDGKALFFVSDRDGREAIYRAVSAEEPIKPLSESLRFKAERVTDDPAIERGPAVSPDGKKLSFVRGRGDLVVRDLASGGEHTLVSSWNAPRATWSPDSEWIAYQVEDTEYNPDVWIARADGSAAAVNISQHPDFDGDPQWSADGQVLSFVSRRDGTNTDLYFVFLSPELHESSQPDLLEYFEKAAEKAKKRKPLKDAVASGKIPLGAPSATQPAAEAASKPARKRSGSAHAASKPAAGDAKAIVRAWVRSILDEPADKAAAGKKTEKKKDDKEEKKDDDKPDKPEKKYAYGLADAFKRIRRVTTLPGDQSEYALSPDGGLLAFVSSHEGEPAIYSIKWDGEDRKKLVTAPAGGLHWGLTGERFYYLNAGVPNSCKAAGGDVKTHAFAAKMAISRREEVEQKFRDAARALRRGFYDPNMKGLDWEALTEKYLALALRTNTNDEYNSVFNMLQGELNASHMGASGPGGGGGDAVGYLGVEFDPAFAGPGLRVKEITPNGPADRAESRLYVGDVILKVNGEPVGPDAAIDRALINTVADQVIIEIQPSPDRPAASQPTSSPATRASSDAPETAGVAPVPSGEAPDATPHSQPASAPGPREIVIRPIAYGTYSTLQYQAWVDRNAKYVAEKSGGRVGYLHIQGMGEPQFHVFERDLYAVGHDRDGLIIDVRNNGGGWTADWVLAVLSVKRHAFTISPGGRPGYPQDRLVFYAWTKPATMMCNQFSFSNAEIVSHAFKNLGRGPLVGTRTFGGVISTGSYGLIDGGAIRMPGRGWFTIPGGVDMENNGAQPDIEVDQTPEDEELGRQRQLDAAIQATLERIEREGAAGRP